MGLIRKNTESTLFTKIDKVIDLLTKEIDNDQVIKRYLTYLTREPLKERSTSYDDKTKYYQRDITTSLLDNQKIDISKNKDGSKFIETPPILFPYPYQQEKISKDYPTVFVYNYTYECEGTIGENIFKIDILIPSLYLELKPYGENRSHKIMERIAYLFDGCETDKESSNKLGANLKFELIDLAKESKLVKSVDSTLIELQLVTRIPNARRDINGYNTKFK